ncbi:MAG TPA: response regulator transcription factor [Thermomicrobiales bacterium]|nr:response regulator transcription factor [Thermomicrobiales bacterium]
MRRGVSVLLVDDHVLFRQALRHLLETEQDIRVVGEASDGSQVEQLVEEERPDVVVMDISMPAIDGIVATQILREKYPSLGIIVLTMFAEDSQVIRAIRAGADGYLLKNIESGKVVDAIRAVARGESVVDPELATKVLNEFRRLSDVDGYNNIAGLTEREISLLQLVANGLSNKEIASELGLAESTVKNRLSILFQKLDVKDRTQAAIYAMTHGLVTSASIS